MSKFADLKEIYRLNIHKSYRSHHEQQCRCLQLPALAESEYEDYCCFKEKRRLKLMERVSN